MKSVSSKQKERMKCETFHKIGKMWTPIVCSDKHFPSPYGVEPILSVFPTSI